MKRSSMGRSVMLVPSQSTKNSETIKELQKFVNEQSLLIKQLTSRIDALEIQIEYIPPNGNKYIEAKQEWNELNDS